MAYDGIHLPKGYEVAIQTDPTVDDVYTDLGVTYADGSIEFTYDTTKWTGSQGEKIKTFFANMQIAATFDLAQIELDNIHKLMSGASDYTTTSAGTTAREMDYDADGWEFDTFYPFTTQSMAGVVPTSISLTQDEGEGGEAVLVLNEDYIIFQDSSDRWGFQVLDTATTDTTKTLDIDYTTAEITTKKITVGSQSVDVTPRAVRIRKNLGTTASPKYFTVIIYSATNESGLSMSFPRHDATEPTTLSITLTGTIDTDRTDLDQLFSIEDAYGV